MVRYGWRLYAMFVGVYIVGVEDLRKFRGLEEKFKKILTIFAWYKLGIAKFGTLRRPEQPYQTTGTLQTLGGPLDGGVLPAGRQRARTKPGHQSNVWQTQCHDRKITGKLYFVPTVNIILRRYLLVVRRSGSSITLYIRCGRRGPTWYIRTPRKYSTHSKKTGTGIRVSVFRVIRGCDSVRRAKLFMTGSGKHFVQSEFWWYFSRKSISAVFNSIFRFLDIISGVDMPKLFRVRGLEGLVLVAPANH